MPFDARVMVVFDEPPERGSLENAFSLVDSNQFLINGKGEWRGPNTFVFSPDSLLAGKMRYQIRLWGKKIKDRLGNVSMIDSVFTSSFVTLNPDTLGIISGVVKIEGRLKPAPVVLLLGQLNSAGLSYKVTLAEVGPFKFGRLLPGEYLLYGYLDLNEDGILSLGQPKPFSPLEPFTWYPDTIKVRSRWETEGVELKFH